VRSVWDSLEIGGPPSVRWLREVGGPRVALLLGAFDPVTNAHLLIVEAASRIEDAPAALCLTKITLDRPSDTLLDPVERLGLLSAVCDERGLGLCVCNRGTYLGVAEGLVGFEPVFVIGSDKLPQLEDPSFYEDGVAGVERTFTELRFLVVRRAGTEVERDDVDVIDEPDVFPTAADADISATEVRRRVRSGESFSHLVPAGVALALGRYTAER